MKKRDGLSANYKNLFAEVDAKYTGTPIGLGKSVMTYPGTSSSSRLGMTAHHLDQFLAQTYAEVPNLITGAEAVVGKYSNYHKEFKHDMKVIKKIEKYKELTDKPNYYYLFLEDMETGEYDAVLRKPFEDLQEDFGILYNNDFVDSLEVGMIVKANKMIIKSSSYDEVGNYKYGVNANVLFNHAPYTHEDAAGVRAGFCKKMQSINCITDDVNVNTNEILINTHGQNGEYKGIPDINEPIGPMLVAIRQQNKSHALFDMSDQALNKFKQTDHFKFPPTPNMYVADIEIFCNKPDLEDNKTNAQIIKYLHHQTMFWEEVYNTCKELDEKGKISKTIDSIYKKARKFVDSGDEKWRPGTDTNPFESIQIRFHIYGHEAISESSKVVARFGNKSVICAVIPDDKMIYTINDDGSKTYVDFVLPDVSIPNRTIGGALPEHYIGFIKRRLTIEINKLRGDIKKQRELLFDVIKIVDEDYGNQQEVIFDSLSDKEQQEYMDYLNIIFRRLPMSDATDDREAFFFYRLLTIYEKYEWARRKDKCYVNKYGRVRECINDAVIGSSYMLTLKQTGRRGHSARGAGSINITRLPDHSSGYKTHSIPTKDSAVRLGVQEAEAFATDTKPEELALIMGMYRSSPEAREALLNMTLDPDGGRAKFKDLGVAHSIPSQLYDTILKSASLRRKVVSNTHKPTKCTDKNLKLRYIESTKSHVLMSDYEYAIYCRRENTENIIKDEYPVITTNKLNDQASEFEDELYFDGDAYDRKLEEDKIFNSIIENIRNK